MATLAAPGFYAPVGPTVISATASFTGQAVNLALLSDAQRSYAADAGYVPDGIQAMPGATRLAGSFGARRGRRFLNQVSR